MKLKEWKKNNRKTNNEISAYVGVSSMTVSRWIRGLVLPNLSSLIKISELTGGEVTAKDFVKPEDSE